MTEKKAVGRPPKYKSKEEIEEKIDAYFKECEGEILTDKEGDPVFDKFGNPVVIHQRPPTVTGLALALGFTTRLSLLNYQGKKEFMNTITRAKTMIEAYTEERLFDRDGTNGAQFSLRNNFKGWNDRQPSELDQEEQKARIEQLRAQIERAAADTERIRRSSGHDENENGGVEIINDAPTGEDIRYSDTEVSEDIQQQND